MLVVSIDTSARVEQGAPADAVDPIRCWWRTSAGAVAIGETFTASLTCAVRDEETTRVTLDESRLGAAVIQLAPFEVLGGSHPGDLRSATHRFAQYHYTVRIIDRDVIGHDASFPNLQLNYKVQTRVGPDTVDGRDRVYLVPGRAVRVLSLVPADADDIRDSRAESFSTVETLRFRGRALRIVALALAALGVLMLAPAAFRLARGTGRRAHAADRVENRAVVADANRVLTRIEAERAAGWTHKLAAEAAGATRVVAACALDRRLSQQPLVRGVAASEGRLAVRRGWLRRAHVSVASAVTASDLDRALDALPLTTPAPTRQVLEDLRLALARMTVAIYGRGGELDAAALDESLRAATRAADALHRRHRWPGRILARSRRIVEARA
jgi:hypothetical protein